MSSTRSLRHQLIVCLILAGVLFRGMIPAGFMPATGEAARKGALLVLCLHGQLLAHGPDGGRQPGGLVLEQCPFGAAATPALPHTPVAFHLPPDLAYARPAAAITADHAESPRLRPPARAPPLFS
ncbi:MAG: hypothetical protein JOY51_03210 [Nevskia sp.]|nr:hypothetical protein [Nevskia sp.]